MLFYLFSFPIKEWGIRMSYRTGPCSLCSYFLQKNGGNGCHPGLNLTILNLISYKRMEEKDVIADTTLSIILSMSQSFNGTDLLKSSIGGGGGRQGGGVFGGVCSGGNRYDTLI